MSETEVRSERHRFCPSCGTEAIGAASFCSDAVSLVKTSAQPSDAAMANQTESSVDVAPVKKSRKWFWPVGVAAILLVAAGIIFGVPQIRHDVLGDVRRLQASFGYKLGEQRRARINGQHWYLQRVHSWDAIRIVSGFGGHVGCKRHRGVLVSGSGPEQCVGSVTSLTQGCVEGFNTSRPTTTPTTRPRAGQVGQGTTNAPCSPCGSDVQPYSGNSGGGAGDVQPYSGNS